MKKLLAMILVSLLVLSGAAMAETLKMGTNAAFPPYEFYDDTTGKITGIDAEIAKLLCDELGYDLEIIDMDFAALVPAVASGKIDFSMAGMTVTEERLQSVDFSTSYATGIQSVIVKEGSPITSVADLTKEGANYKVGVQLGTTGDLYATWDIQDEGFGTVEQFNTGADAVMALTSGKVDCVLIDNQPAIQFVAANEGLVLLDTEYIQEQYAICLAKGSELTAKFNEVLEAKIADGSIDEIIHKYIAAE